MFFIVHEASLGNTTIFSKSLKKTQTLYLRKKKFPCSLNCNDYANFEHFFFTNHILVHIVDQEGRLECKKEKGRVRARNKRGIRKGHLGVSVG